MLAVFYLLQVLSWITLTPQTTPQIGIPLHSNNASLARVWAEHDEIMCYPSFPMVKCPVESWMWKNDELLSLLDVNVLFKLGMISEIRNWILSFRPSKYICVSVGRCLRGREAQKAGLYLADLAPSLPPQAWRGCEAQHCYLFSSVGCVMENLSKYFSHSAFTSFTQAKAS